MDKDCTATGARKLRPVQRVNASGFAATPCSDSGSCTTCLAAMTGISTTMNVQPVHANTDAGTALLNSGTGMQRGTGRVRICAVCQAHWQNEAWKGLTRGGSLVQPSRRRSSALVPVGCWLVGRPRMAHSI